MTIIAAAFVGAPLISIAPTLAAGGDLQFGGTRPATPNGYYNRLPTLCKAALNRVRPKDGSNFSSPPKAAFAQKEFEHCRSY